MCKERETLSRERRAILNAAIERLIPSDDGPGASEADVILYVERAIYDRSWHFFHPLLERGLDFFQSIAQHEFEKSFIDCSNDEQNVVLGKAQRFPNNEARRFFDHLLDLALEGFLCDPIHLGNKDYIGWKFIGYDPTEADTCEV